MDHPTAFEALELETDCSVGEWAIAGVGEWGTVASVVPGGFPDHARVFHPAWRLFDDAEAQPDSLHPGPHEVRWSEVAAANDRTPHPLMEWASITGSWRYHWGGATQPRLWDEGPEEGSLSQRQVAEMVRVLVRHTSTPEECVFALWEGFGDLPSELLRAPRLHMPQREMVLFRGPVSAATVSFAPPPWSYRSASLWWPADRAWCVGTDVDLRSSYIGGSVACVDELIADPALEAMRVGASQSVTFEADRINPEPAREHPYG